MLDAGVDGFRINFSHGAAPDRLEQISWVRQLIKKPINQWQSYRTCRVQIRLGILVDNMLTVSKGDVLTLDSVLRSMTAAYFASSVQLGREDEGR